MADNDKKQATTEIDGPNDVTVDTPQHGQGRSLRWLKYGTNVGVLLFATVAIVVMVNWISYTQYIRLDFTASGMYSLSPQTERLLDSDDRRITFTALYAEGTSDDALLERVRELMAEYERHGDRITVREIDPASNPQAVIDFIRQVRLRFNDEITLNRSALGAGREAIAAVRGFAENQQAALLGAMSRLQPSDRGVAPVLQQLAQLVPFQATRLTEVEQEYDRVLGSLDGGDGEDEVLSVLDELPDFAEPRQLAIRELDAVQALVVTAIARFNAVIDDRTVGYSDGIKDALLGLRNDYEDVRDVIDSALARLQEVQSGEYDVFRRDVLESNSVVVTAELRDDESPEELPRHGVAVLPLTEIYPSLIMSSAGAGIRADQGYKGEEAITGALVGLTSDHNTRVVFVNPYPQSMFNPRVPPQLTFRVVAERLQKLNFKVDEWMSGPSMQGGQMVPPSPKPIAEPGETMILVIVPPPAMDPQRPELSLGIAGSMELLAQHVGAGRPAVVFMEPQSQIASISRREEMIAALKRYGITALTTQGVLTHVQVGEGERQVTNQVTIDTWPRNNEIALAMRGLTGLLVSGTPLETSPTTAPGTNYLKLIETPAAAWGDKDFFAEQRAERDDSDTPGPLTVGIAAEKSGERIVVIGDRFWASDYTTTQGARDGATGQLLYAAFAANAELFVNSVYWLAGLEGLIGPGAASRDVRRIDPPDRPTVAALWWLVVGGLPTACLGAGVAVYFMRRG